VPITPCGVGTYTMQHPYTSEGSFTAAFTAKSTRWGNLAKSVQITTKEVSAVLGLLAANILLPQNQGRIVGRCGKLADSVALRILDEKGQQVWPGTGAQSVPCTQIGNYWPTGFTLDTPGVYTVSAAITNPECKALCETQAKFIVARQFEEVAAPELPLAGIMALFVATLLLLWGKP